MKISLDLRYKIQLIVLSINYFSFLFCIFISPNNSSGGLEWLVGGKKENIIDVPEGTTVHGLVLFLRDNLFGGDPKREFCAGDDLYILFLFFILYFLIIIFRRPGILYLINDADFALVGEDHVLTANE